MYQFITSLFTQRKALVLCLFVVVLNFNFGFAQNCAGSLSVENDFNVQSVYKDGATFDMVLTNTSSKPVTYIISTTNLKESCATENKKTSSPNVMLDVQVKLGSNTGLASKSVTLKAGETRKFGIFVTIPPKTPYNTWSCIEVLATAKECNQSVASSTIRVFVPDPSDG